MRRQRVEVADALKDLALTTARLAHVDGPPVVLAHGALLHEQIERLSLGPQRFARLVDRRQVYELPALGVLLLEPADEVRLVPARVVHEHRGRRVQARDDVARERLLNRPPDRRRLRLLAVLVRVVDDDEAQTRHAGDLAVDRSTPQATALRRVPRDEGARVLAELDAGDAREVAELKIGSASCREGGGLVGAGIGGG